jgi:hypothetical protein
MRTRKGWERSTQTRDGASAAWVWPARRSSSLRSVAAEGTSEACRARGEARTLRNWPTRSAASAEACSTPATQSDSGRGLERQGLRPPRDLPGFVAPSLLGREVCEPSTSIDTSMEVPAQRSGTPSRSIVGARSKSAATGRAAPNTAAWTKMDRRSALCTVVTRRAYRGVFVRRLVGPQTAPMAHRSRPAHPAPPILLLALDKQEKALSRTKELLQFFPRLFRIEPFFIGSTRCVSIERGLPATAPTPLDMRHRRGNQPIAAEVRAHPPVVRCRRVVTPPVENSHACIGGRASADAPPPRY